jgi:hypothetical protein
MNQQYLTPKKSFSDRLATKRVKRTHQDEPDCGKRSNRNQVKRFRGEYSPSPIRPQQQQLEQKQGLTRQSESLTFIADLASTSTPTKQQSQPIVSTPKARNHDPVKYHPTQTIRSKQVKRKPLNAGKKRIVKQLNIEKYMLINNIQSECKNKQQIECRCCRDVQIQSSAQVAKNMMMLVASSASKPKISLNYKTTSSNKNSHNLSLKIQNFCNLSDLVVSTIVEPKENTILENNNKYFKKQSSSKKSSTKRSSSSTKNSHNKITLKNLMYTPSKLKMVKQEVACISSKAKSTSKVYYL